MEKMSKRDRGNTVQEMDSLTRHLETWSAGMRRQSHLASKASTAADLALCLWFKLTDEQRAALQKDDQLRYLIGQLITNYGYSWT